MIDLIVEHYGISNPCEIAELIEQDFNSEVDLMTIEHYMSGSNKVKDYYINYY